VGVCVCAFCNVWLCVCLGFVMCGCVYGGEEFCNVWVFVCLDFAMCGCVCMCGFCNVCGCVYVWVL